MQNIREVNIQTFGGSEKFDPSKVIKNFNYNGIIFRNKPKKGGLWTSSLIPKEKRENEKEYSEWAKWCIQENFHSDKYQNIISILYPKKNTKIYIIDCMDDLVRASSILEEVYLNEKIDKSWLWHSDVKAIDYPRLFKEYSGVRVTEYAAKQFHMFDAYDPFVCLEPQTYLNLVDLNYWDCESTIWRDADWIDHIEYEYLN